MRAEVPRNAGFSGERARGMQGDRDPVRARSRVAPRGAWGCPGVSDQALRRRACTTSGAAIAAGRHRRRACDTPGSASSWSRKPVARAVPRGRRLHGREGRRQPNADVVVADRGHQDLDLSPYTHRLFRPVQSTSVHCGSSLHVPGVAVDGPTSRPPTATRTLVSRLPPGSAAPVPGLRRQPESAARGYPAAAGWSAPLGSLRSLGHSQAADRPCGPAKLAVGDGALGFWSALALVGVSALLSRTLPEWRPNGGT